MNENTYNSPNEMRFPISFGIFPVILFSFNSLNNYKKKLFSSFVRVNRNIMKILTSTPMK